MRRTRARITKLWINHILTQKVKPFGCVVSNDSNKLIISNKIKKSSRRRKWISLIKNIQ